jgi:hypothetical protein
MVVLKPLLAERGYVKAVGHVDKWIAQWGLGIAD